MPLGQPPLLGGDIQDVVPPYEGIAVLVLQTSNNKKTYRYSYYQLLTPSVQLPQNIIKTLIIFFTFFFQFGVFLKNIIPGNPVKPAAASAWRYTTRCSP